MKKNIICFFLFLYIFNVFADTTSDLSLISSLEEIKETIRFGIEKEVISILNELGHSPKKEFYPLLLERYKEASIIETKKKFANYFSDCDNIPDDVLNLLYEEAKNEPNNKDFHATLLYFLGNKGKLKEGLLLIERLDYSDNIIQLAAADALSKMENIELVQPILKRLKLSEEDEEKYLSSDIISKLILSFGKMKSEEAIPYLREAVSNDTNDKFIIMYAMLSLAEIRDIESIDLINKNLGSDEIKIQEYAGYSLSLFKDKSVIPILRKMLRHNNEKIRIYACQGLVLNNDLKATHVFLYKFKKDPSGGVKKEALSSLIDLGNTGINALKEYMKDKKYSPVNLYVISDAVRKKPTELNVQFIISLYESSDKKERDLIAKNVINGDSNKLDPIINKLLKSEDYLVRIGAIKAVYKIKDSSLWGIVEALSKNDSSEIVKKTARKYLGLR